MDEEITLLKAEIVLLKTGLRAALDGWSCDSWSTITGNFTKPIPILDGIADLRKLLDG